MITTISYDQTEIIESIIKLHAPLGIQIDPTYSKGNFYKTIEQPKEKYDIEPQTDDTIMLDAADLPHDDNSVYSIMFDPPFLVATTTGKIYNRFGAFKNIKELWEWYDKCLARFYQILEPDGTLIFKCQDIVNSNKQWWSHIHIINEAEKVGFYTKDLFILLAKSRMVSPNQTIQQHARKFHSYFLVFKKPKR